MELWEKFALGDPVISLKPGLMNSYHLYQPELSAVAGKSIHLAHSIKHSNTSILVMELRQKHQFIWEAIQIKLYTNNMKKQGRFSLSRSLKQNIISKDKLLLHYKTTFLYLGPWKTRWFLTSYLHGPWECLYFLVIPLCLMRTILFPWKVNIFSKFHFPPADSAPFP